MRRRRSRTVTVKVRVPRRRFLRRGRRRGLSVRGVRF